MNRILSSLLLAVAVVVTGCATLPPPKDRLETAALTDTAGTRLGRAIAPGVAANPGKTGIHALPDPRDAFAARVLLAGAAERSLDVQYFIWNGDHVGYLLFQALWQAAERGVRVRLLLDDMNTKGLDSTIAALDAHPNIEVRLYNPLVNRNNRMLNFVTDFTRVNRRMHNKSFTADNQATVVGGRNIADEYFGAGAGSFNFDQRSARLNTEMGLVLSNPVLAQRLTRFFDVEVPMLAYEVRLTPDGNNLEWIERTASGEKHYDTEPETKWSTRMGVELLSILPIEWLL